MRLLMTAAGVLPSFRSFDLLIPLAAGFRLKVEL